MIINVTTIFKVENEYGSFYACDKDYKMKLKNIFKKHVGNKAVLYTTDGYYKEALKCGPIEGVYATVDFGTSTNVTENFRMMRTVQPKVKFFIRSICYKILMSSFFCGSK